MSLPSEPNEFRYGGDARRGAFSLLGVAVVLFIASLITGAWAIASLAHASFLDTNDLPVGDNVAWGVRTSTDSRKRSVWAPPVWSRWTPTFPTTRTKSCG